jgi:hypothetical protein
MYRHFHGAKHLMTQGFISQEEPPSERQSGWSKQARMGLKKSQETNQTAWCFESPRSLFLRVEPVSSLVLCTVRGFSFFTFVNNPG